MGMMTSTLASVHTQDEYRWPSYDANGKVIDGIHRQAGEQGIGGRSIDATPGAGRGLDTAAGRDMRVCAFGGVPRQLNLTQVVGEFRRKVGGGSGHWAFEQMRCWRVRASANINMTPMAVSRNRRNERGGTLVLVMMRAADMGNLPPRVG